MFEKDEQKSPSREVETIIGPSVKVEGNFSGDGNVIVDGSLQGTLKTRHNLRVGKEAKIKADIQVANLTVSGEIRGNVKVSERTELSASAKVIGNLETKILSVEPGAVLQGKVTMMNEVKEFTPEKNVQK
ncbi:MAG: polymer-forming cytoskeletal protein [Parcubacteria group bacterium]